MKKVVFIFLFLASGLACAFAQQSGTCGENLTWTLDEDGTLTISGTGPMSDFSLENRPWGTEITRLILDDGITYIGNKAFYGCNRLTGSLTLPAGLTNIGSSAFSGCSGFAGSLTLPAGLTNIGSSAFYGCSGFTGPLTIPEGLISIGYLTFYGCSGFTGPLTLPAGLTNIGSSAFFGCSGFTGPLTLPVDLTSIGERTFYGCSGFTGSLTLPVGLTSIGEGAFNGCKGFTGSLTLPAGLTSIGKKAFSGCSGFTGSLTLPVGLTSIGEGAFNGCSGFTGSLTLPAGLTSIGERSFNNCSGFTGSLILPTGLTSIGRAAFNGCKGFTGSLTLPVDLTSIGNEAFSGCSGFTGSLTLPAGLTSIGNETFLGCSGFTGSLTLPAGLTSIGNEAFSVCSGFTGSLTLPVGLTSIGSSAFWGCIGLTDTLVLYENLLEIRSNAFANCDFSVVLNENKTPIVIAADVFYNLTLSDIKLCVPAGSKTAYSQAEVWKEFTIEEYGVGIHPSFDKKEGLLACGTGVSISGATEEEELYYGLGKGVVPTLRYTSPIVVTDTTYISACSRVRNVYSDTVHATYIPEHASSFVGMDWDWSAEHKATLSLTCPRCKTELKPEVNLSEELIKEASEDEAGLKIHTAIATANEVTYKSTNREVLARLLRPIHDTVVKTDTVTSFETIHDTVIEFQTIHDTVVIIDTVIVTDTVYIQVLGNTENETMKIKLYPNPTRGSFTVEAEEASWMQIYNAAGACIQSNRMHGGKFTGSLPSSGLYLIKLTIRDRTYTKRLLVQ